MNALRLRHKIIAQNLAASIINELAPDIIKSGWRIFGGKKILNQGNVLSKKFKDTFSLRNDPQAIAYFHASRYSVWLRVRANSWDSQGTNECAELSVLLFNVNNDVLESKYEFTNFKSDWTLEGVTEAQDAIRDLENKLSDLKMGLPEIFR